MKGVAQQLHSLGGGRVGGRGGFHFNDAALMQQLFGRGFARAVNVAEAAGLIGVKGKYTPAGALDGT